MNDNENSTYEWSDWLSFGKWGTHIKRSSKSPDSHLAKISTDEFIIKGNYTDTASKIQKAQGENPELFCIGERGQNEKVSCEY